ncbi:hypothetical protein [Corynebacterium bovis]|uniref:hypothetical protein n=1 Tax=Corynebacterium bovis TaxID=36808 RepID=UPI000F64E48C|nr:hypothetical protein [Corynebacterium bovis]
MSRRNSGTAGEDKGSSGFGKIIAAGFLVAVVVVAAALFIVNRKSGDGDAGGGSAAGESSWNAGGEAMDSRSVADRFDWADRKADINGQMVYKPEPRVGKILSETTRSYPSPTGVEASTARPEGVVFETIDMERLYPIPFSMSDGPTGFEGNVPVGYTRSAAGAALAAGAYNVATIQMTPDPQKLKSIVANPSPADIDAFQQLKEDRESDSDNRKADADEAFRRGYIVSPAGYKITAYDGSYAQVMICDVTSPEMDPEGKSIRISSVDLIWTEQGWKVKMYTPKNTTRDSLPEGLISWMH